MLSLISPAFIVFLIVNVVVRAVSVPRAFYQKHRHYYSIAASGRFKLFKTLDEATSTYKTNSEKRAKQNKNHNRLSNDTKKMFVDTRGGGENCHNDDESKSNANIKVEKEDIESNVENTASKTTKRSHSEAQSNSSKEETHWFPLESNPQLFNQYASKLGFDTINKNALYEFVDVFSTEQWAIDMIPQPVVAVILLFPLSHKERQYRANEELLRQKQQHDGISPNVWFARQRITNACGTFAILHALANIPQQLKDATYLSKPPCWLHEFMNKCPASLDPLQKATLLEADQILPSLHEEVASDPSNQTSKGKLGDKVGTHFATFVHVDGKLYELDGRKGGPICHGPTTEISLLKDACRVSKTFMDRADPKEVQFGIVALVPKQNRDALESMRDQ